MLCIGKALGQALRTQRAAGIRPDLHGGRFLSLSGGQNAAAGDASGDGYSH